MLNIRSLELHACHVCNLSCKYCTHYSDNKHKGILSLEDSEDWMKGWSNRIQPEQFAILGGEPALNPKLPELIALSRNYWPHSRIILVSNGFFLHRHPTLEQTLLDNNVQLHISIHSDSPEYTEKLVPVRAFLANWKQKITWRPCYKSWSAMYRGYGNTMEPFADEDQRRSWEICECRTCSQLFHGDIWKCPNIAYLKMQLEKFNLQDNEKWTPYMQYKPLSPSCSDLELTNFFEREDEFICKMCPSRTQFIKNDEKNPLSLPVKKKIL